jgi:hypothetical protein
MHLINIVIITPPKARNCIHHALANVLGIWKHTLHKLAWLDPRPLVRSLFILPPINTLNNPLNKMFKTVASICSHQRKNTKVFIRYSFSSDMQSFTASKNIGIRRKEYT